MSTLPVLHRRDAQSIEGTERLFLSAESASSMAVGECTQRTPAHRAVSNGANHDHRSLWDHAVIHPVRDAMWAAPTRRVDDAGSR